MYARATSKGARSEARVEGKERGNLIEITPKPPDAQGLVGFVQSDKLRSHSGSSQGSELDQT